MAFKNLQNKKSTNGLKVKNDNGPVSVFICYCSAPRWFLYILHCISLSPICISSRSIMFLMRVLDWSNINPICWKSSLKLVKNVNSANSNHCVKSVQIWRFFLSVFTCIWTEWIQHAVNLWQLYPGSGILQRSLRQWFQAENVIKSSILDIVGVFASTAVENVIQV